MLPPPEFDPQVAAEATGHDIDESPLAGVNLGVAVHMVRGLLRTYAIGVVICVFFEAVESLRGLLVMVPWFENTIGKESVTI